VIELDTINYRIDAPFSKLFELGDARYTRDWSDYERFGFSSEHVPHLCTLMSDDRLHCAAQGTNDVWVPVHAWRILGQLKADEAISPALKVLTYYSYDDEFVGEELPEVLASIGPPAVPALVDYLADILNPVFARVAAAQSLKNICERHAEVSQACIDGLHSGLKQYIVNDDTLNAFLVNDLVELRVVDSLATIREAYQSCAVDAQVFGDLEDMEVELGVREARSTPRQRYGLFAGMDSVLGSIADSERATALRDSKEGPVAIPPRPQAEKIGRNEPCPCGSGKKYKKCCLGR
jgi:hypothetical protein